jgi:TIR domain
MSSPAPPPTELAPFSVFVSYAHDDDDDKDVSKRWLHRLRVHLAPLVRQDKVSVWSDKDIELGENWREKIMVAMRSARAAVLLVGPQFLASEFITDIEVPMLLEKSDADGLVVIPVVLRNCLFAETTYKYPDPVRGPKEQALSFFQAADSPKRPLNAMTEAEQDDVFVSVARRLKQLMNSAPPAPGAADPSAPPGEHARAVEGALDHLSDLVEASERVRATVRRFRSDLEAALLKIELLSAYKALHDLLHTLQFQCFDPVAAELPLFPGDPGSEERLGEPEQHLLETIDAVRDEVARWRRFEIETEYLLEDLEAAHTELRAAIDENDRRRLRRAHTALGRVINNYPTKINVLLLKAAHQLRLPALVGVMDEIKERLEKLGVGPEDVRQFVEGVGALAALEERLRELLYEHDHWQTADGEMRLLDANAEDFQYDLESLWPRLKVITEVLYRENAETWAQRFKKESEQLEAALGGTSLGLVKSAFARYRRAAGLRFFKVDVELLKLCSSLQTVGVPLDRILRLLDP